MKKYRFKIEKLLTKEVAIESNNEDEAIDFIEKIIDKTDILDEDISEITIERIDRNYDKNEEKIATIYDKNEGYFNQTFDEICEEIEDDFPEEICEHWCPICNECTLYE